jgi:hypothetical protein
MIEQNCLDVNLKIRQDAGELPKVGRRQLQLELWRLKLLQDFVD